MNENELMELWQAANNKIEQHITINKKNAEEITRMKVEHLLSSMKPVKIFAVIAGIIWVLAVGSMVVFFTLKMGGEINWFFISSAFLQATLTVMAIALYLYQLNILYKINYSGTVISIQAKIVRLKSLTLLSARLLMLQLPLWTTFYWNENMFKNGDTLLWVLHGTITTIFTMVAIWLFLNIKYQNRNKWWFRLFFNGKEWRPVLQAMELLEPLKECNEESDSRTNDREAV